MPALAVLVGILTKQPQPASELNANLPTELDRIISKALEKDRETRYQTAAEMRADLKRLKRETESGRTVASTAASPTAGVRQSAAATPSPKARRAIMVGAPVVTLAVIGGAMVWHSQQTPALTARDPVVLADFRNRTGDTMFDDTLGEALAVQLRQSPFLNLLPERSRRPRMSISWSVRSDRLQHSLTAAIRRGTTLPARLVWIHGTVMRSS